MDGARHGIVPRLLAAALGIAAVGK